MHAVTQETLSDIMKSEKLILVIHWPGCSNCARMLPEIEEFEKQNPDIKVAHIEAKNEWETKLPARWILDLLPSNWTYPNVQCFSGGKKLLMIGGIFPVGLLTIPFMNQAELNNNFSKSFLLIDGLSKQFNETIKTIKQEQQAILGVLKRMEQIENNVPDEDWELPTPTIGEDGKKACEACQ